MRLIDRRAALAAGAATLAAGRAFAQGATPTAAAAMKTLVYSTPGGIELKLDLYTPANAKAPLPLIIFVHGGGWTAGNRTGGPDFKRFFVQDGFATASIDYRLVPSVNFPSNVVDVKAAVRFLRANAAAHGLDPDRIGLWGTSAGGHLVTVAGCTPRGVFEGVGDLETSSAVQCVLNGYGLVDFNAMDAQWDLEAKNRQPLAKGAPAGPPGTPAGGGPRIINAAATSPASRLVGAAIGTVPELVKAANPLTYMKKGAPPFLSMHGYSDTAVPWHQSVVFHEAMVKAGNDSSLRLIDGLPHGFFNFTTIDEMAGPFRMDVRTHPAGGRETRTVEPAAKVFDAARDFFSKHLKA